MNGEILSLKTAEKLKKYEKLLIDYLILKNENRLLKERLERIRERLKKQGGTNE